MTSEADDDDEVVVDPANGDDVAAFDLALVSSWFTISINR